MSVFFLDGYCFKQTMSLPPQSDQIDASVDGQGVLDSFVPDVEPTRQGTVTRAMASANREDISTVRQLYAKVSREFASSVSSANNELRREAPSKHQLRGLKKTLTSTYRELHALNDKLQSLGPCPEEDEDAKNKLAQMQTITGQIETMFPQGPDSVESCSSVSGSSSRHSLASKRAESEHSSVSSRLQTKAELNQLAVQLQSEELLDREEKIAQDLLIKKEQLKLKNERENAERKLEAEQRKIEAEQKETQIKLEAEQRETQRKLEAEQRKLELERERIRQASEYDEQRIKEESEIEYEEAKHRAKIARMKLQFQMMEKQAIIDTYDAHERETQEGLARESKSSLVERFIQNAPPLLAPLVSSVPHPLMAWQSARAAGQDPDLTTDQSRQSFIHGGLVLQSTPATTSGATPAAVPITCSAAPRPTVAATTEPPSQGLPASLVRGQLSHAASLTPAAGGTGGLLPSVSFPPTVRHTFLNLPQLSAGAGAGAGDGAGAGLTSVSTACTVIPTLGAITTTASCDSQPVVTWAPSAVPPAVSGGLGAHEPLRDTVSHHPLWFPPQSLRPQAPPFMPSQPPADSRAPPPLTENDSPRLLDNWQTTLTKTMTDAISLNRLPVQEPTVFSGEPLQFPTWKSSFAFLIDRQAITANEKLLYLQKYVGGQAKDSIKGFFLLADETAYDAAMKVLEKRYGNPFIVSQAFRDRLDQWGTVKPKDVAGLRSFSDFLLQCVIAAKVVGGMGILDDAQYQKKLVEKLPEWLHSRWIRVVHHTKDAQGRYPLFKDFADFVAKEVEVCSDPVFGSLPRPSSFPDTPSAKKTAFQTATDPQTVGPPQIASNDTDNSKARPICQYCCKTGHHVSDCFKLLSFPLSDRQTFIRENKLCFGCGEPNHISKNCKRRATCKKCQRSHPTVMHDENFQRTPSASATPNNPNFPTPVDQTTVPKASVRCLDTHKGPDMTSMILPVFVSTDENPERECLVYAMLDTMSDSTFITSPTLDRLKAQTTETAIKITTLNSSEALTRSKRATGLQIRGISSRDRVSLPTTFSTEALHVDASHIPTRETALKHPHLCHLSDHLSPLLEDVEVGLLIGYNCQEALMPLSVVKGQPFAIETALGWCIVGSPAYESLLSPPCHSRKVTCVNPPDTKESVSFVYRAKIAEATSTEPLNMLERNFKDVDTDNISQEDKRFIKGMEEEIKVNDSGHYEMPLPFKQGPPKCQFSFNPPGASHMGGVCERQIRTVRSVLNGLLTKADSDMTSAALRTLLYEVMAVVNSRLPSVESLESPLSPSPLTPNHILTGKSDSILPPPGVFEHQDLYLRKQWRKVQRRADEFWRVWSRDYLSSLQYRRKWQQPQREVCVGDIVVVHDEHAFRGDWRLARVLEVLRSADGRVRSCRLVLGSSDSAPQIKHPSPPVELVRPICKLSVMVPTD